MDKKTMTQQTSKPTSKMESNNNSLGTTEETKGSSYVFSTTDKKVKEVARSWHRRLKNANLLEERFFTQMVSTELDVLGINHAVQHCTIDRHYAKVLFIHKGDDFLAMKMGDSTLSLCIVWKKGTKQKL